MSQLQQSVGKKYNFNISAVIYDN